MGGVPYILGVLGALNENAGPPKGQYGGGGCISLSESGVSAGVGGAIRFQRAKEVLELSGRLLNALENEIFEGPHGQFAVQSDSEVFKGRDMFEGGSRGIGEASLDIPREGGGDRMRVKSDNFGLGSVYLDASFFTPSLGGIDHALQLVRALAHED